MSPSEKRMINALKRQSPMTADELAKVSHVAVGTVSSYLRPMIRAGQIHVSGWRAKQKRGCIYVREYSPGAQIGPEPKPDGWIYDDPADVQIPGEIPRDRLLMWAMGIPNHA